MDTSCPSRPIWSTASEPDLNECQVATETWLTRDYWRREGRQLRRYRYRTAALLGAWRESREDAIADAIRADQARRDENEACGLSWRVPGQIEEEAARRAAA